MIVKDSVLEVIDDIEDKYIHNAYLGLLARLRSRASGEAISPSNNGRVRCTLLHIFGAAGCQ